MTNAGVRFHRRVRVRFSILLYFITDQIFYLLDLNLSLAIPPSLCPAPSALRLKIRRFQNYGPCLGAVPVTEATTIGNEGSFLGIGRLVRRSQGMGNDA
jgi:hypothetical protein